LGKGQWGIYPSLREKGMPSSGARWFFPECGLLTVYSVHVLLIPMGVKEEMHSPREMGRHAHG